MWDPCVLQIRALSFPTAPGRILSAKIVTHEGKKNGNTYSPDLTYAYEIGGRHLNGSVVDAMLPNLQEKACRDVLARYPVDAKVLVYYDPDNPNSAVLEPGISGEDMHDFILASALTLPILWLWALLAMRIVYTKPGYAEAGGLRIIDLGWNSPGVQACSAMYLTSLFAGTMSLVALPYVNVPGKYGALFYFGVVCLSGGGAWSYTRGSLGSKQAEMTMDPSQRILSFSPLVAGVRSHRLNVPYDDIQAIFVKKQGGGQYVTTDLVVRTVQGDSILVRETQLSPGNLEFVERVLRDELKLPTGD